MLAAWTLLACLASPARAQRRPEPALRLAGAVRADTAPLLATTSVGGAALPWPATAPGGGATRASRQPTPRTPWWAPIASAALPGSGQAALGQDRWLAFAALEGLAWFRYAADLREARRERREYRSLADRVARALFGGTRPVGSFEYYEHMERYVESGVYDAVPGGAIDPEPDSSTFNGATWLLARQTYWPDPDAPPPPDAPEYLRALEFYDRRAIRPEFRWSWRNAQLEQDLFRGAIARSNGAFRRSAQDVAVVLANHVLSTVDAYVTVRIRHGESTRQARRDGGRSDVFEVEAALPWPRLGGRGIAPTPEDRQ